MEHPTNITLDDMPPLFAQHLLDDAQQFDSLRKQMEGLASKDDTAEILKAIKSVHLGWRYIGIGWRSFLMVGAIAGALIAIITFGKLFLAGVVAVLLGTKQ